MATEQEQIKEGIDYCVGHYKDVFESAKGTIVKMRGERASEMIIGVIEACVEVGFKLGKRFQNNKQKHTMNFSIQEIRNYILSQDSIGDVLYNLSEEAIAEANRPIDKNSIAYQEGMEEFVPGRKLRNPYRNDLPEYKEYEAGWMAKELEYETSVD